MAVQLQLRKGTKAQNDAFVGAEGELTYDTQTQGLRIHDGTTQGGHMIDTVVAWQVPTAENNYTWYRKYASGWVEQGGTVGSGSSNPNPRAIVFPVEMADTNYAIFGNVKNGVTNNATFTMQPRTLRTTGMDVYCTYCGTGSGAAGESFYWEVKGMSA